LTTRKAANGSPDIRRRTRILTQRLEPSSAAQSRCGCTSVIILLCAQLQPRRVTPKRSPTAKARLQLPSSPIAAALGEHQAYCSGVPVFEADIADQRSSKLAVGLSASTGKPFDVVVPAETAVEGACVLTLAAVAATASRATATNPVIVRCFVIRTS
jgi:hypothetical protein